MIQGVQTQQQPDNAGGLVTLPSLLGLPETASPNCRDIEFGLGGAFGKRAGVSSTNSVVLTSTAGWASVDFGAAALRWHVVAAGTGIYASSNRGTAYVAVATNRSQYFQSFERSKSFLMAASDTYDRVMYWAGSVGTFFLGMPISSAPAAKYPLDFGGFLLLMNGSGGYGRVVTYADNNAIATDPWTSSFEVGSSQDDEITGGTSYNTRAYIFTKYTTHQVSQVGGNPDFSVRQIKDWGAVPHTIEKVTYGDLGEVIICLGYDKRVRIFDGSDERIISTPAEQNNNLTPLYFENINGAQITRCHAEVDTQKQLYKLWVVMSPSTEVTHCFNLNLRTGAWFPYTADTIQSATMALSNNTRVLLQVAQAGRVSIVDSGNTDNGVAIDEVYDSRPLFGPTPGTVSKHRRVEFFFAPTSSGTIYFQDVQNLNRTFGVARDTFVLSGASATVLAKKVIDLPVSQSVIQFRMSNSASTAPPWTCVRYDVEKTPLGTGDS